MKPLRVLSLFDGISCGQVALERAGIPIEVYYASENSRGFMAITSLNMYKIINTQEYKVTDIYDSLSKFIDNDQSYFKLNLISNDELFGEYVFVQNIKQPFYNIKERSFQIQVVPKAFNVPFSLTPNGLLVWSNKTNSNRFLFVVGRILSRLNFQSIEINIEKIIEKIGKYKTKISEICIDDMVLIEDIVGSFSTNLHDYGESFNVIHKYRQQISKLNFQYYTKESFITISIAKNGCVMLYKDYKDIDVEQIQFLKGLFLE